MKSSFFLTNKLIGVLGAPDGVVLSLFAEAESGR
jgi:hypothetical protein